MFSGFTMRQERESEVFFRNGIEQLEILLLFTALTFKRDQRAPVAATFDVDDVRGRIDVSERLFAFDFNSTRDRTDLRQLPASA